MKPTTTLTVSLSEEIKSLVLEGIDTEVPILIKYPGELPSLVLRNCVIGARRTWLGRILRGSPIQLQRPFQRFLSQTVPLPEGSPSWITLCKE